VSANDGKLTLQDGLSFDGPAFELSFLIIPELGKTTKVGLAQLLAIEIR